MKKFKDGVLSTDQITIKVTNKDPYSMGSWVMDVKELDWHGESVGVLSTSTQEEAEVAALKKVKTELQEMLDSLPGESDSISFANWLCERYYPTWNNEGKKLWADKGWIRSAGEVPESEKFSSEELYQKFINQ